MRIHRLIFIVASVAAAHLHAQSNTFPSSGNVGVGTASPAQALTVEKSANGQAVTGLFSNPNSGSSAYNEVQLGNNANARNLIIQSYGSNHTDSLLANGAALYTATGNMVFGTGFVNRMTITGSGNVGVGTTAPAYMLHATGDIGVGGDMKFFARYNGSEAYKGSFGWSHLQLGNNGPNWIVAGRTQAGGSLTFIVNNTNDYAYNSFNGTPALHLGANGNVGVGMTTPTEKLHVYGGDIRISDTGAGAVAQLLLDSNTGAGDVAFLRQGTLKFMARADVDSSGATLDLADRSNGYASRCYIAGSGNVGIGTTSPTHKLAVNGTIRAKEVIVDTGWADHVFATGYRLAPLSEVEQHIQQNGRLPDVPSATEVATRGVSLGEMQKILLQKVEELTLHQIEQEKRLDRQAERIRALETENAQLRHP